MTIGSKPRASVVEIPKAARSEANLPRATKAPYAADANAPRAWVGSHRDKGAWEFVVPAVSTSALNWLSVLNGPGNTMQNDWTYDASVATCNLAGCMIAESTGPPLDRVIAGLSPSAVGRCFVSSIAVAAMKLAAAPIVG